MNDPVMEHAQPYKIKCGVCGVEVATQHRSRKFCRECAKNRVREWNRRHADANWRHINITVPLSVYDTVAKIAAEEGASIGAWSRAVIEAAVREHERKARQRRAHEVTQALVQARGKP